jgi:hypothetical protein
MPPQLSSMRLSAPRSLFLKRENFSNSGLIQSFIFGILGILLAAISIYLAYLQLRRHYRIRPVRSTGNDMEMTTSNVEVFNHNLVNSNASLSQNEVEVQHLPQLFELEA